MGRWLAPLLPGPQHWVCTTVTPDLLAVAAADAPGPAADGASVVVETRLSDITRLDRGRSRRRDPHHRLGAARPDDRGRAGRAGRASAPGRGCPVLLTLSVVGRVELAPADPLDSRVAAAFDAHQRRMTAAGRLLGPDAVAAAVEGFRRRGPRWSSGRAPGGSAPPRPTWRRSGSPGGSAPRASRRPSWPPKPSLRTAPADAGASRAARRHGRPRRPPGAAVTARIAGDVGVARAGGRRRDARRRGLAPGHRAVPRRCRRGGRRGAAAAAGIGA